MLLRSSSTPVLGSLLSNFTDSPNSNIHSETSHALKHLPPTSFPQHYHKLSVHQTGSFTLPSFSCGSSPISPSIGELERQNKGFRRVQSDGNLQDLAYSCNNEDILEFSDPPKRFSTRNRCLVLETIPSFSLVKHNGFRVEEEDEEMESESEDGEEKKGEGLSVVNGVILSETGKARDGVCRVSFGEQEEVGSGKEMYLAKGLGVECCGDGIGGCIGGGGGSSDHNPLGSGGNDGDRHEVEEYYKKMVKENPGDPLFLRNYANFLYQVSSLPVCFQNKILRFWKEKTSIQVLGFFNFSKIWYFGNLQSLEINIQFWSENFADHI